jgi:hypothetical protein
MENLLIPIKFIKYFVNIINAKEHIKIIMII